MMNDDADDIDADHVSGGMTGAVGERGGAARVHSPRTRRPGPILLSPFPPLPPLPFKSNGERQCAISAHGVP
eukprot:1817328-Rhodomonas_salina.1